MEIITTPAPAQTGHLDAVVSASFFKPAKAQPEVDRWTTWQVANTWWNSLTSAEQIAIFATRQVH